MPPSRVRDQQPQARPGLRARLFAAFLVPVLLLGLGGMLLLGLPGERIGAGTELRAGVVYFGLLIVAVLVAIGLAIHMGDRVARPVAWLLRLMDAGQVRLLSKGPPPASDWEIETLSRRVQVLLRQNLAGAGAMEELDALSSEITAVLDAAVVGRLDPERWPKAQATHPQTRRLLDFYRVRNESLRDATQGLTRLEGLLEQDWRDGSRAVQAIAERSERSFLAATEMALEFERLERLARPSPAETQAHRDALQTFADLQLGFEKWRARAEAALEGTQAQSSLAHLREWSAWVDESLRMLAATLTASDPCGNGANPQLASTLEKVSRAAAGAGQEMGALSRDAERLQQTWEPLSERLQSLLVRIGEVQARPGAARETQDAGGDAAADANTESTEAAEGGGGSDGEA